MKKMTLFFALLFLAILVMPSYAAKPEPQPGQVEVVNEVDVKATIKGIARVDGEVVAPDIMSWYEVINLPGPGTFIEAGANAIGGGGITNVVIECIFDGETIVSGWPADIVGSKWPWHDSKLTFGYPVSFESSLVIRVQPTSTGFSKILVSVIYAE